MSDPQTVPPHLHKPAISDYVYGFVLAIILTVIPFAMVAFGEIDRVPTLVLVTILAVVQMVVHFRFFLHYSTDRTPMEAKIALAFSVGIGVILIAGCIWIMSDLHYRMMP